MYICQYFLEEKENGLENGLEKPLSRGEMYPLSGDFIMSIGCPESDCF